jgi:hypothetical protein
VDAETVAPRRLRERPPGYDSWIPAPQVRAEAKELGISRWALPRLSHEGLLAEPWGEGLGQALGRSTYRYPPRSLDQLRVFADARRWRRDYLSIRHWEWWGGSELEDWSLWKQDRLDKLQRIAAAFEEYARLPQRELPREREEAAVDLADWLGRDRQLHGFRQQLRGEANRQSFSHGFLALATRDTSQLLPGVRGSESIPPESALLMRNLDEPIDSHYTLGQLQAAGSRLDQIPELEKYRTSAAVINHHALIGDPRDAPRELAAMSEAEATLLRDIWRSRNPSGLFLRLRTQPLFAAIALLAVRRASVLVPELQAPPS